MFFIPFLSSLPIKCAFFDLSFFISKQGISFSIYIYSFSCLASHFIQNPLLTSRNDDSLFPTHSFQASWLTLCHVRMGWSASTNRNSLNLRTWVAGEWVRAKLLLVTAGGRKSVSCLRSSFKCCNIFHLINSVRRALVGTERDARGVPLRCTEMEDVPWQV